MRPLDACCLLARRHNDIAMLNPDRHQPKDGVFTGGDLILRVNAWYNDRYGKLLTAPFAPDRIALLIRGQPWIAEVPNIMDTAAIFISSADRSVRPQPQIWPTNQQPRINVLDQILDLPEGLRHALKPVELAHLLKAFLLGFESFRALHLLTKRLLSAREVLADLDGAVHYLTHTSPHHGQVRWSALQALEKL